MDLVRIRYLKEWISQLPPGNITYKTINGKKYAYYQWTENGKQNCRRVKDHELDDLMEKISQRKSLEKKLSESPEISVFPEISKEEFFFSYVLRGQELLDFVEPVREFKKRGCFSELHDYVYGDSSDRVFVLYGIRRTGKTTLIRQLIAEMPEDIFTRTAYVQINDKIDLAKINLDMRQLARQGYKYVFIDEVTLMDDFIEGAALFSDIFASSGMKIVLSGTDSLGFVFSADRELYDRCFMLHTTFIPYREFENVLGIKGIDEYIRYGGTMSMGGLNYNRSAMTFATKASTDEYVDLAIARNIQHSLQNYQYGEHFRNLNELYNEDELTSAINRVVEDINHRFTLEVLTREFRSGDLALSAKNMLRDRSNPDDVLYRIDTAMVTQRLKEMLEIRNKSEQSVAIKDVHRKEIKEYLDMLDLTVDLDIVYMSDLSRSAHTAISQPGMRYAQAEALVNSLMKDSVMRMLSLQERNIVTERILSDIMGRMMEDIVVLETKIARPECEVFKLVFASGEFDMVVFNPQTSSCAIYEVKHSRETAPQQYRHLLDEEKCRETEFRYGPVTEKAVIYRGPSTCFGGVKYINIEEYLNDVALPE